MESYGPKDSSLFEIRFLLKRASRKHQGAARNNGLFRSIIKLFIEKVRPSFVSINIAGAKIRIQ